MTFEHRFAEFVQKNPKLAADENMKVTFTLKQFKKICAVFFRAGESATPSLWKSIFGNDLKF